MLKANGDQDGRQPKELREHPSLEFVAIEKEILKTLDKTLDNKLLKILVNFFLVVGITTFIGLCLALFDVSYNVNKDNALIDVPGQQRTINTHPFGPYDSWSEFTDNCCCLPSRGINGTNFRTEMWKCKKSLFSETEHSFKAFVRELDNRNGYTIREYCSSTFLNSVCEPPKLKNGIVFPGLCSNATGSISFDNILKELW